MISTPLNPLFKVLFICFCVLSPMLSHAQEPVVGLGGPDNDKPLRDTLPQAIQIAIDASKTYTDTIPAGPYILPDSSLVMYSGEYIVLELETSGKTITRIKTVKVNAVPDRTIVLHLSPDMQNASRPGTVLEVRNPFPYRLSYEAKTYSAKRKKWRKENVMPVSAKTSNTENWVEPVVKVSLTNWKLQ